MKNLVGAFLWVGGESLSQAEEFKYLQVSYTVDGRMEWDLSLLQSIMVK